ncbi:MAG TPA: TonB-dependent receptor [Steroidobacteraceae bacterium]|nr:TonB-dependent receptor [Steroidobacteraceae bacterium]
MRSSRITVAALTAATIMPAIASAQESTAPGGNQIEEVVVTAQKRAQNFSDVGIAVTAFSGDEVAQLGFEQLRNLASQTPNVQIKDVVANSVPNITIRGVGLNDYATNNNPAAGIYVDDVYLVSPAMLTFGLFDLERVEILKGPQGTLFGRNTTAGTVNFISRAPSEQLQSYLNLDYGRYERALAEGGIGGPLSDTVSGRVSFQTVQQGSGWQINRLNGDKIGEVDRTAARAQLDWRPNDAVNVLFNVHGGRDQSDVWLVKIDNPFSAEDDGDSNPYRSGASDPSRLDIKSHGAAVTVDWTLAPTLTLTSVSGYEKFSRLHIEDRDGVSLKQLDGYFDNDIEQYSQELRLTHLGESLVLIGGLFYGKDEVSTRDRFDAADLLPLLGLNGVASLGNEYQQDTKSTAAFLHSEWQFAPSWKLTAGARYTDDRKDFHDAFTYIIPTGGSDVPLYPSVSNDYEVNDVSGKVGIDYSGFERTLLYASVSRGFKSGGFQGQLTFDPAVLQPFKDENLIAYEVGMKTRLLGNTLQLNTSAFFYDYQDLQFYGGLFDSPVGVLFGITNVGDAEVKGAEADLWWRPARGLDIRLGLGLLDTKITKSVVAGVATGSELPNSPDVTFNTMVRYEWPVGSTLRAEALFAANYQGDVTFDVVRDPPEAREDAYWLADARIGIGSADDRWNVSLWARNLADERYRTQVLFSSVGFGSNYGAPRTYGISVMLKR